MMLIEMVGLLWREIVVGRDSLLLISYVGRDVNTGHAVESCMYERIKAIVRSKAFVISLLSMLRVDFFVCPIHSDGENIETPSRPLSQIAKTPTVPNQSFVSASRLTIWPNKTLCCLKRVRLVYERLSQTRHRSAPTI